MIFFLASIKCKLQIFSTDPLCKELWATTSATEYQMNEAFEDLTKHFNWDILKDCNEFF
jgi:hypothetical protein